MILEYHRPQSMDQALELLSRNQPVTLPLGGGTVISRPAKMAYAVVDLQALGLNRIERQGNQVLTGATVTLQSLYEYQDIQPALRTAIHNEASLHIRNAGTVAGTLAAADGRSPFAIAMMALDARLIWQPGDQEVGVGDWLPLRGKKPGILISRINIPIHAKLAYEAVTRTPADRPIAAIAVARWPSGRIRIAGGGVGRSPVLVLDGPGAAGAETAARDAYSQTGDELATAEYRQDVVATLVRRCLQQIEGI